MHQIKKILCVTDLSEISRNAEYASLRLSQMMGARLTVLSCGSDYSHLSNTYFDENAIQSDEDRPYSDDYLQSIDHKKKELQDHFKQTQKQIGMELKSEIEYQVKLENEVSAVLDLLQDRPHEFDLIVVGKGKNSFWERFLFGVPAKEISDETKISTLFMPAEDHWRNWIPKKTLVACALNASSRFAEQIAVFLSSQMKSGMTLMHVVDMANLQIEMNVSHIFPIDYMPVQMQTEDRDKIKKQKMEQLEHIKRQLEKEYAMTHIEVELDFGRVGDALLQQLEARDRYDLLVMGSRGQNALKKFFLGSNTDELEEVCSIPLLIANRNAY